MMGLSVETLIVGSAALAAVLTVFAVWSALLHRDPLAARARALVERREALRAAAGAPRRRQKNARAAVGVMRSIVTRLNLMRSQQGEKKAVALAQAGYRSNDAMIAYVFARLVAPPAMAGLAAFLVFVMHIYKGPPTVQWLIVAGGAVLGVFLPDLYVKNAGDKRRAKITKGLPDGIDLMVICAEAGLSLDATLQRVAKELGRTWPELSDEFSLTSVEIGFLPDRRQALENLSVRTGIPAVRALVNTLGQTEKYGTPLADSLRVLAAELRHERLMRAEEKAARLPVILTVPMMLFILPPLFIVLIGPGIIQIIDGLRVM